MGFWTLSIVRKSKITSYFRFPDDGRSPETITSQWRSMFYIVINTWMSQNVSGMIIYLTSFCRLCYCKGVQKPVARWTKGVENKGDYMEIWYYCSESNNIVLWNNTVGIHRDWPAYVQTCWWSCTSGLFMLHNVRCIGAVKIHCSPVCVS